MGGYRYQLTRIDPKTGVRKVLCELEGSVPMLTSLGPRRPESVLVEWSTNNEPKYSVLNTTSGQSEVAYRGSTTWYPCPSPDGAKVAWTMCPEEIADFRAGGSPLAKSMSLHWGVCVLDLQTHALRQLTWDKHDIVAGFADGSTVLYFRQKHDVPTLRAVPTTGGPSRELWTWKP